MGWWRAGWQAASAPRLADERARLGAAQPLGAHGRSPQATACVTRPPRAAGSPAPGSPAKRARPPEHAPVDWGLGFVPRRPPGLVRARTQWQARMPRAAPCRPVATVRRKRSRRACGVCAACSSPRALKRAPPAGRAGGGRRRCAAAGRAGGLLGGGGGAAGRRARGADAPGPGARPGGRPAGVRACHRGARRRVHNICALAALWARR